MMKIIQQYRLLAIAQCCLTICFAAFSGCGGGQNDTSTPQMQTYLTAAGDTRDWLTTDELLRPRYDQSSPIHNSYFMPIGDVLSERHTFEGTIYLQATELIGPDSIAEENLCFPDVPLRFVSHDGRLIPLDRDILREENGCMWDVVLSPGKVWSETDDNGWSRASFPFIFVHGISNLVHNGIATFLYNQSEISFLRIQKIQETIGDFEEYRFDMWGQLPVRYTPQVFDESSDVIIELEKEVANQSTVLSWADFAADYPKVGLRRFDGLVSEEEISATGIITDSAIYLKPPQTRYGPYPYPMQMRHAVWSVTKSLGGAVALLRLAQKYSDDVVDLLIRDYVPVTATHNGWDTVTFMDCLDMASGIGDSLSVYYGNIFADERESDRFFDFYWEATASDKLDVAFSYGNYPWEPGTVFSYNSMHTFMLSAAIDSYLKHVEGPEVHLWDWLVDEVYRPIGISHSPKMHTIESDGSIGLPLLFMGMLPTIDDVAKISRLFQNNGAHHGTQILSPSLTATALAKTADKGLHAWWFDSPAGESKYKLSFWSVAWNEAGCLRQVPYMAGFGGNMVAILPNGFSAFRFADEGDYNPFPLINVAAKLAPLCP